MNSGEGLEREKTVADKGRIEPGTTIAEKLNDMDEYDAYRSAELAELYDVVYAQAGDGTFWLETAAALTSGPILELGCGTGRLLLPLARAGHEVTGIDLATHMLERCRTKLKAELRAVRDRVTLREGDMTSFDLGRRFTQIHCAFGTFHHLDTVEQQLACLAQCRKGLLPGGALVLDLINPDPSPVADEPSETDGQCVADNGSEPADSDRGAGVVAWSHGRQIRSWARVVATQRALQRNDVEVTYEIVEADGTTRPVTETFPMRFVFRYELEHLLARSGFRIVELYGDYDRSAFGDESLGMIVVAVPDSLLAPGMR